MKGSGKPDDRKGQVRFDVAGAGDGFTVRLVRHCQTKGAETDRHFLRTPRQSSTLPILQGESVRNLLFSFSIIFVLIKARVEDRLNYRKRGQATFLTVI